MRAPVMRTISIPASFRSSWRTRSASNATAGCRGSRRCPVRRRSARPANMRPAHGPRRTGSSTAVDRAAPRTSSRKRRSRPERVNAAGRWISSAVRSRATPLKPRCARSARRRRLRSSRPRRRTLSSAWGRNHGSTAAKSKSVRGIAVTGISFSRDSSSSQCLGAVHHGSQLAFLRGLAAVTSIGDSNLFVKPQSHAADRWLSSAPSPQLSTAAKH